MESLQSVFQDIFENDALTIDRATTAADVAGWDSLTHVTLIVHVEKVFAVRFTSSEVATLGSVGDLVDLIERHLAKDPGAR